MAYSPERKAAVLAKMLPPNTMPLGRLAREEGISVATPSKWQAEARAKGQLLPDANAGPGGWTSEDKLAAVIETASLNEAELGAYCRRRGIHAEQVAVWRAACARANDWDRTATSRIARETKDARQRIQQLEPELARKEKALAEAAAVMILRKKAQAIWDDARSGPAGSGRPVDGPKQIMPRAPARGGRRGGMTPAQDRRDIAALNDEATAAGASFTAACAGLGLSPRTLQRWRDPAGRIYEDRRPSAERPTPANKLLWLPPVVQELSSLFRMRSIANFCQAFRCSHVRNCWPVW